MAERSSLRELSDLHWFPPFLATHNYGDLTGFLSCLSADGGGLFVFFFAYRVFDVCGGVGILRKAHEINRWVDELDGMGGWHPRKTRRASLSVLRLSSSVHRIAEWCSGWYITHMQTVWEGGVYKLMMVFPEGSPVIVSITSSLKG